jgi:hypothetical protein
MKAVIDRIENHVAVLLFGEEEVPVNVPLHLLPRHVHEGTWLSVGFEIDSATTTEQFRRNKSLLERLKRKNPGRTAPRQTDPAPGEGPDPDGPAPGPGHSPEDATSEDRSLPPEEPAPGSTPPP